MQTVTNSIMLANSLLDPIRTESRMYTNIMDLTDKSRLTCTKEHKQNNKN